MLTKVAKVAEGKLADGAEPASKDLSYVDRPPYVFVLSHFIYI